MKIFEQIGIPATLEQLAEECTELAQAALKESRRIRGENPTPKTADDCMEAIQEELADVLVCIREIGVAGYTTNDFDIAEKALRWEIRVGRKGKSE